MHRGRSLVILLAVVGLVWGAVAYQILWGNTSIVVTRRFVTSPVGTLSLLPVRLVLAAIHVVEDRVAGRPFDFSRNHEWIGYVAAATGALLSTLPFLVVRKVVRSLRRNRAGVERDAVTPPDRRS